MNEKITKLIEEVKELSVMELSELVKALEEEFGVSAAAPMAVAVAPVAGGDAGPAIEEKTSFNVVLTGAGDNKVGIIKAVKEATGLGLMEAKELVNAVPKTIKENVNKEEAEKLKTTLTEAGGVVDLQ